MWTYFGKNFSISNIIQYYAVLFDRLYFEHSDSPWQYSHPTTFLMQCYAVVTTSYICVRRSLLLSAYHAAFHKQLRGKLRSQASHQKLAFLRCSLGVVLCHVLPSEHNSVSSQTHLQSPYNITLSQKCYKN